MLILSLYKKLPMILQGSTNRSSIFCAKTLLTGIALLGLGVVAGLLIQLNPPQPQE
jgi:hypothetical protein